MESQAGPVVANELYAVAEEGGYGALDDFGRNKLRSLCQEFHQTYAKVSRETEIATLLTRVQRLARFEGTHTTKAVQRPAMLQVQQHETLRHGGILPIGRLRDRPISVMGIAYGVWKINLSTSPLLNGFNSYTGAKSSSTQCQATRNPM